MLRSPQGPPASAFDAMVPEMTPVLLLMVKPGGRPDALKVQRVVQGVAGGQGEIDRVAVVIELFAGVGQAHRVGDGEVIVCVEGESSVAPLGWLSDR